MRSADVLTLSGGEKRRVALCRALLSRPDFLILDEPTNHLDTGSIEWLEDFLARYNGTCLFVTHDRYFLDRVATRVVELSRGKFYSYAGNYTDYLLARAERQAVEEMQEKKRQKFLKRELAWVRKAPRARRTKSVDRIERYFETGSAGSARSRTGCRSHHSAGAEAGQPRDRVARGGDWSLAVGS